MKNLKGLQHSISCGTFVRINHVFNEGLTYLLSVHKNYGREEREGEGEVEGAEGETKREKRRVGQRECVCAYGCVDLKETKNDCRLRVDIPFIDQVFYIKKRTIIYLSRVCSSLYKLYRLPNELPTLCRKGPLYQRTEFGLTTVLKLPNRMRR